MFPFSRGFGGLNLWIERNGDRTVPWDSLKAGMTGCAQFFPSTGVGLTSFSSWLELN